MTEENKNKPRQTEGDNPRPLMEDKGLPPLKQVRPMPQVKPPKKDG